MTFAAQVASSTIARPDYDRATVATGIVHIGVGGFHRAHQALAMDTLMNEGKALDWGICGVGLMPSDSRMRDAMAAQDCEYTLVSKHNDGNREARIIGGGRRKVHSVPRTFAGGLICPP